MASTARGSFFARRGGSGDFSVINERGSRYAQLTVFGLIAATLIASLLWAFSVVDNVFHTVATGEGERALHQIRTSQREQPGVAEQELAALVDNNRAAGLRCIAMLDRGWRVTTRGGDCVESVAAMERDRLLAKLGEMSAVLVHEIRNPLASLKGHAQLLLERLPERNGAYDQAAWIVRESVRLERLCEDLVSLFRSNRLDPVEVDPAGPLREAADAVGAERIWIDVRAAPPRR